MLTTLDFGNGPVSFFNGTPHAINLITDAEYKPKIRKYVGGRELAVIPASGEMLSAKLTSQIITEFGQGVYVCRQICTECDPLPALALRADYTIVSAMYATAYKQARYNPETNLVTIHDLVVESMDNPKPLGCRGFAVI